MYTRRTGHCADPLPVCWGKVNSFGTNCKSVCQYRSKGVGLGSGITSTINPWFLPQILIFKLLPIYLKFKWTQAFSGWMTTSEIVVSIIIGEWNEFGLPQLLLQFFSGFGIHHNFPFQFSQTCILTTIPTNRKQKGQQWDELSAECSITHVELEGRVIRILLGMLCERDNDSVILPPKPNLLIVAECRLE